MKYIKSIGVPVMYYVLVETEEENDELVIASVKEMLSDIAEENWDDQFDYDGNTLEFEGIEWLDGAYAHLLEENTDETTEATEGGTSTASGELRSPVGDVQAARERDEGLPM